MQPSAAALPAQHAAAGRACAREAAVGVIGARWRDLDGRDGPLGCPTAAERTVAGGTPDEGTAQEFEHGVIARTPSLDGEGTSTATVVAYPSGRDLVVNWAGTTTSADAFQVGWVGAAGEPVTHTAPSALTLPDGSFATPLTVRLAYSEGTFDGVSPTCALPVTGQIGDSRGQHRIRTRLRLSGAFEFKVKGCTDPWIGKDKCYPGAYTVPVRIGLGERSGGPCTTPINGLIKERWHELGAWDGPLGCPTTEARPAGPAGATRQQFDHGQIVTSPPAGAADGDRRLSAGPYRGRRLRSHRGERRRRRHARRAPIRAGKRPDRNHTRPG
ncbi:hypothetical protein J5X84_39670 [Streptosporangiaceae bacterium NEAU-GS5]|nr:hypothetical protein [Streptosporangiaceae bacterium NEAU-GS5]